jgi:hypothetical protein
MSIYTLEGFTASDITGTTAVTSKPCTMAGFYVNSTTGGTLVFRDGGASGTVLSGTITPAIGFHRFPALIGTSLHATIANTLDVTIFFQGQG